MRDGVGEGVELTAALMMVDELSDSDEELSTPVYGPTVALVKVNTAVSV